MLFKKKYSLKLFQIFFFLFITVIIFSSKVKASNIDEAETYIENLSGQIISIVDDDLSVEQKQTKLYLLFNQNASIVTIARAALGHRWRTIDENTKQEFTDAFTRYLVQKYGKQFEEFKGSKLVLERSIDAGKRGILVHTRLLMPATSPISVKWQVWRKTTNFKLIDIIIEDISMLTMEREEIKNRLAIHSNNVNLLINDLK